MECPRWVLLYSPSIEEKVTSRYGPVGCRTLPVRALCRPDGRQTYVGRDEWSQDEPISHALGHLASGIIILVGNG